MEEVTHNTEITDGGERKRVLRVDVIIPAYKPGKKFSRLLKMLSMQTYPIGKIIVMNTEKAYWNEKGFEGIGNLEVHHLSKEEFDHGATRNRGARYSRADIMVFMTDDAVPADEKLIENAIKYVETHIARPDLSVEELSHELGMSRVHLYKKLLQITGKTPIEFIRIIRLKRAAQLLRESQQNVSEVAYQVGFNNPKYFSKYFKDEFGVLPSVYQEKEGK